MEPKELLEEYKKEYERCNGRPIEVIPSGGGWYRLRQPGYISTDAYRLGDIEKMLANLRRRI